MYLGCDFRVCIALQLKNGMSFKTALFNQLWAWGPRMRRWLAAEAVHYCHNHAPAQYRWIPGTNLLAPKCPGRDITRENCYSRHMLALLALLYMKHNLSGHNTCQTGRGKKTLLQLLSLFPLLQSLWPN